MKENTKSKNVLTFLLDAVIICCGTFIMSIGFSVFLVPNHIMPGGFSGIALLVSTLLSRFFNINISTGLLYILFNIPVFIVGFKDVGKRFFALSLIGMVSYSQFIDFVKLDLNANDPLLCAVYGGILIGIGLGVVCRANGSTGGTDMLGNIINRKYADISIGKVVIIIDFVVISSNVFINGYLTALYAVIAIFLQGIVCDYIIEGERGTKAYYIISDKCDEIAEHIMHEVHRGVTEVNVRGMYSNKEHGMLFCLVSRRQVSELRKIVFAIDSSAFVFSTTVKDAMGKGFAKYVPKKARKVKSGAQSYKKSDSTDEK